MSRGTAKAWADVHSLDEDEALATGSMEMQGLLRELERGDREIRDLLASSGQEVADVEGTLAELSQRMSEMGCLCLFSRCPIHGEGMGVLARAFNLIEGACKPQVGLPPLTSEGVLWLAAIDRVPIEDRIAWVATLMEQVRFYNARRAEGEAVEVVGGV